MNFFDNLIHVDVKKNMCIAGLSDELFCVYLNSLLTNKKNIELPIGDICGNCCNLDQCNIQEQIAQYNYSDSFTKMNCSKCLGLNGIISLEDIQKNYVPLGFHNFILPDYCNSKNNNIIKFFINYFIKDSDKLLIYEFIEEQMYYD